MEEDSVVFEGTPLGEYLRTVGFEEEVEEVYVEEQEPEVPNPLRSKWSRIRNWLASIYRSWRSPGMIKKLKTLLIQRILKAGVIEEAAIMAILEEKGLQLEVPEANISWSIMKKVMGESLIAVVPAVTMVVAQKSSFKASMVALVPTVALLVRWGSLMPVLCEYSKLDRYLEASRLFKQELRKAARTVNEQSLISKGYNINMQGCASAWRLEREDIIELSNLAQSSLPGVRIALLQTTSRLALQFSRELQMQRQRNPLPYHMDQSGLGLPDIDESDEAEKNEVPSLATIRVAITKLYLKEGEFVKRLLVDLLSSEDDSVKVFIDDELSFLLISCVQELKTSFIFHKTLYCQTVQCSMKPEGEDLSHSRFHSHCHGARGHLEEAMRTAEAMENYVEGNNPFSVPEPWFYLYQKLKYHTDVSSQALEKAYILLVQKTNNEEESSAMLSASEELGEHVGDEVQVYPCPTDEVFEVIGEGANDNSVVESYEGSAISVHNENSKLMLQELKAVIKVKGENWEEREKKAREKTQSTMHMEEAKNLKSSMEMVLLSSSTNDGEKTPSSLSSWVLPSAREPLNDLPPAEEGSGVEQSIFETLASEAVAIARLNQATAVVDLSEEEFMFSEDDN